MERQAASNGKRRRGLEWRAVEPLDRATIWPYARRRAGRLLLPALRPSDGRRGRAGARRARGRRGAALPSGTGAIDGAGARAPRAGADDRARRGRLLRHRGAVRGARALGHPPRRVRPDRPAARRRRPRLARGALEPVPDDARPRGRRRAPGARGRRLDRRDARLPAAARARRRLRRSTARRSTSAATQTSCSARSSAARRTTPSDCATSAAAPGSSPRPTRAGCSPAR